MVRANGEVMDVTVMEDTALLALMREHPEKGCEQLLQQYTGLVLAIVRRRLGGCTFCTAEDMEELASDILFAFWQQRERVTPDRGTVRALLATMTGRRCIDWYRAHAARAAMQSPEELSETVQDPTAAPDEQAVSNDRKRELLAAIRALGEPDCEILLRKYYNGETAASIAERLSMRTGTVEMRISRAMKKLRTMLGGDEDAS